MSLFKKASKIPRRLKMYIYGESGTGKTITSLHFPRPVVIDMERGTEHYAGGADGFEFDVLPTTDPNKVKEAINELVENPGDYKTLVIDPMTVFYDQLIEQQLKRKRIRSGNSSEVLIPLDYKPIQHDMKAFINKLIALDMNIILTAHSTTLYSNEPGDFMKSIGTKPEGYRKLPFMMDVVLELTIDKDEKFHARVIKDRTNKLPKEFEFTYKVMAKYFGIAELEREAEKTAKESLDQLQERTVEIMVENKSMLSAGITGKLVEDIQNLIKLTKIKNMFVKDKLQADYGVDSLLDLKEDEAEQLFKDLQNQTNNE